MWPIWEDHETCHSSNTALSDGATHRKRDRCADWLARLRSVLWLVVFSWCVSGPLWRWPSYQRDFELKRSPFGEYRHYRSVSTRRSIMIICCEAHLGAVIFAFTSAKFIDYLNPFVASVLGLTVIRSRVLASDVGHIINMYQIIWAKYMPFSPRFGHFSNQIVFLFVLCFLQVFCFCRICF